MHLAFQLHFSMLKETLDSEREITTLSPKQNHNTKLM